MLQESWRKRILKNIPHGEEGSLALDTEEDVACLCKILLNRGYAICLTGGDGDDVIVHWLYAGDIGHLSYSDYENVVFTSTDYIEEYPQAYYEETNTTKTDEDCSVGLTD